MSKSIEINVNKQTLLLKEGQKALEQFPIQTSRYGLGTKVNSFKTPTGHHVIHQKIGCGCSPYDVFSARRCEKQPFTPCRYEQEPDRDWILSRILWLQGREQGHNLGADVDSQNRYIYIHGCPEQAFEKEKGSHGCIRMLPKAIIKLFDRVEVGTPVFINGNT